MDNKFYNYTFGNENQHSSCLLPEEWEWVRDRKVDLYLSMITNKYFIRMKETDFRTFVKTAHDTVKNAWTIQFIDIQHLYGGESIVKAIFFFERKEDLMMIKLTKE